jgi:hypothetical protein
MVLAFGSAGKIKKGHETFHLEACLAWHSSFEGERGLASRCRFPESKESKDIH